MTDTNVFKTFKVSDKRSPRNCKYSSPIRQLSNTSVSKNRMLTMPHLTLILSWCWEFRSKEASECLFEVLHSSRILFQIQFLHFETFHFAKHSIGNSLICKSSTAQTALPLHCNQYHTGIFLASMSNGHCKKRIRTHW